jgi:hypothetical protein
MQVHHPGTWQRQILKGGDAAVRTPCGAPQIVFSVRIRAVPELLKRTVRRLTLRRAPVDADSAASAHFAEGATPLPGGGSQSWYSGNGRAESCHRLFYSGDGKEVTVVAGGSRPGGTATDTIMAHLRSEPGQGSKARGRRSRPLAPLQLGRSMLAPASQTLLEFVSNLLRGASSLLNGVWQRLAERTGAHQHSPAITE